MPAALVRTASEPGMAKLKSLWSPVPNASTPINQVGTKESTPVKQIPNSVRDRAASPPPESLAAFSSEEKHPKRRSQSVDHRRTHHRLSVDVEDHSLQSLAHMLLSNDPDASMRIPGRKSKRSQPRSASKPRILMKRDPSLSGGEIDKAYLKDLSYEKLRQTARPLLQQLLVASFIVELLD
ncbi:hypothetical protein BDR26DRAFT_848723 [Obelidium mucronatum]|nr:hypothetical protein BDR26DRAFT_848723 [Obelidium mucronatum]